MHMFTAWWSNFYTRILAPLKASFQTTFQTTFKALFQSPFQNKSMYALASWIKVIFGVVILTLTLTQLNVKEDPEIALIMLLIGVGVVSWGVAYFLFYRGQYLFMIELSPEQLQKTAYKCSLLFGLYSLLNMLIIIGGWRNKWI